MKKVKLFLSAVILGVALASCGGIDSKLDAYEKACKDRNATEMAALAAELTDMQNDMTPEQKERLANIAFKCL